MTTPIFGYSGVGKSTYANEFPAVAKDMQQQHRQIFDQFMLEVGKAIQPGEYKYVFLPCDLSIKQEFLRRRIAYIVVLPCGKLSDWVRRCRRPQHDSHAHSDPPQWREGNVAHARRIP